MLDQDFTPAGHAALEGFVATRIAPRYPECPFTGNTEVVLHDTSRRLHGEGGYPICRIPVDPDDQMAVRNAEALLVGFARELDGNPLDWTSMRRRRKTIGTA